MQTESEEKSRTIARLCGEVQCLRKTLSKGQHHKGRIKDHMKKVEDFTNVCQQQAPPDPPPPGPTEQGHSFKHPPQPEDISDLTSKSEVTVWSGIDLSDEET